MKKSFFLLILASFLFSVNVWAKDIEIAVDIWEPYQIRTDSGYSGYSIELVTAVMKTMDNVTIKIIDYPWKRALHMITNGDIDALFSANYTKERESFAWYPKEPLVKSQWVIWVKAGSPIKFETYADLENLTAGVVRGYSYTDAFWSFLKSKGRFYDVTDDEINFKKLHLGRIDYTVAELGNGIDILKKNHLVESIQPLTSNPIKEDGLYIMFNKKRISKEFCDDFSDKLTAYKKTTEYKALYKKYFER